MKKIGITGNIASGKSAVEKLISDKGFSIIDADYICHCAYANNEKIINKIKNLFNKEIITDNAGKLDRKKIGQIVFSKPEYKKQLENIIHPFIIDEIQKFINQYSDEKLVFISVPLLFEAEMEGLFDKIILVTASEDKRLTRLMERNNLTKKEALLRIEAQNPQEEKIKLADFVIENNSDLLELEQNTEIVINQLL